MDYLVKGMPDAGRVKEAFENHIFLTTLTNQELQQLKKEGRKLFYDYEMSFQPLLFVEQAVLKPRDILLVTLEEERCQWPCQYTYKVSEKKWEKGSPGTALRICCYTSGKWICASRYLHMLDVLHQLSEALGKKMLIMGRVCLKQPYYEKLMGELTQYYMKRYGSLILYEREKREDLMNWQQLTEESRMDSGGQEREQIQKWLGEKKEKTDDPVRQIPADEILYSPLCYTEEVKKYDLKDKKLQQIQAGLGRCLFRGEKQVLKRVFNRQNYLQELLIPVKAGISGSFKWTGESSYQGENVYVGMILTEHGNYLDEALKKVSGQPKTACVWQQEEGGSGKYYDRTQLGSLLAETPSLSEENTIYLKNICGRAEGAAKKAELVIARIHSVPRSLAASQLCPAECVFWGDVVIAAARLKQLADRNHKPLILILPYEAWLSESRSYRHWLEEFASQPGCMVLMPAGDGRDRVIQAVVAETEADQLTSGIKKITWNWEFKSPGRLTGYLEAVNCRLYELILTDPKGRRQVLTAAQEEICKEQPVYLETTGLYVNEETGYQQILWKQHQAQKGKWQLTACLKQEQMGEIHIRLKEQEADENLKPEVPGAFINERDEKSSIVCVAAFDHQAENLYDFSMRGAFLRRPLLAVSDELMESGEKMHTTLEAACFMAGVMACLYSDGKVGEDPCCIRAVHLISQMLHALSRTQERTYPHQALGYGVLDQKAMIRLLGKEEDQ